MCPKCGDTLERGRCLTCGWEADVEQATPTVTRCAYDRCRIIVWRGPTAHFNYPRLCRWHREWDRLKASMGEDEHLVEREAHRVWFAETQAPYGPQTDAKGRQHEITADLAWSRLYEKSS